MLNHFFRVLILILLLASCNNKKNKSSDNEQLITQKPQIVAVEINDLVLDSSLSIRAIEIENETLWFAGEDGWFGRINVEGRDKSISNSEVFSEMMDELHADEHFMARKMKSDSLGYSQRSIAKIDDKFFTLTIGNPAILTKYMGGELEEVYKEVDDKVFYDAMEFWNDNEGIAIGDPTQDCMSIIITRDGGDSWNKIDCSLLPASLEGEAAFAASDSNIALHGDLTWIATGGVYSRVLFSPDKGQSWEVFETPIIQGKPTTGIYSIDFYDSLNGFAIGGDYTDPESNIANKIRTTDGGRTWKVVGDSSAPGYRSCIKYIPGSNASELVAIGFKGIDYSGDHGETWDHLSDEGFYTIRMLNDTVAYAAGKGRISKLLFKRIP